MMKLKKNMFFKTALVAAVVATSVALGMGSAAYAETGKTVLGDSASQNDTTGNDTTNNLITDEELAQITVSNLNIDSNFRISYELKNPSRKNAYYQMKLEKAYGDKFYIAQNFLNTNKINNYFKTNNDTYVVNNEYLGFSVKEGGKYRFSICVKKNEDDQNGKTFFSNIIEYTEPSAKLPAPTNVKWGRDKEGNPIATWTEVSNRENVLGYDVFLYGGDDKFITGYYFRYDNEINQEPIMSFVQDMEFAGNPPYKFKIRTSSSDVTKVIHSEWVESEFYAVNTEEVNKNLDEIIKKETINNNDVENIKKMKSDLQISMQSNKDTLNKIVDIENKFNKKAVQIVGGDVFKQEEIKIVGAKLNASKEADVSLNVAAANEEDLKVLGSHGFTTKNALAFNMNLNGAGVPEDGHLDVPVSITLPIPAGMDSSKIKVVHYSNTYAAPEIYRGSRVKINGDGTFTITITHFSLFAVVEDNRNVNPGSDSDLVYPSLPNAESNSEAIIVDSNGNTVVEPERWVPTTPDEIKRYAFLGKEPVVFANAEGNAYPVKVYNSIQGPKCFVSFEAVLADYTMARTYNIYPNNKPGYSMDSKARITIEIPELLRQKGRTFKMICVTEGGTPIVLNDLDKNPNTITFETDKYYAFALIYK